MHACVIAPIPLSREGVGVSQRWVSWLSFLRRTTVAGQRRTTPASPIDALTSVFRAASVVHIFSCLCREYTTLKRFSQADRRQGSGEKGRDSMGSASVSLAIVPVDTLR